MNILCSSIRSVADSPVVPTATKPSVPCSTCQSIRRDNAAQSMLPSGCMGLTKATILPETIPVSPKLMQAANGTGQCCPAQGTNHQELCTLGRTNAGNIPYHTIVATETGE